MPKPEKYFICDLCGKEFGEDEYESGHIVYHKYTNKRADFISGFAKIEIMYTVKDEHGQVVRPNIHLCAQCIRDLALIEE